LPSAQPDHPFLMNIRVDTVSLLIDPPGVPDSDFYSLNLTAGQPVSVVASFPGFAPGAVSFSGARTNFVTPGLPGQTGTIPLQVAYRDLNGDGKLDMVAANGGAVGGPNSAGSITVRLGN